MQAVRWLYAVAVVLSVAGCGGRAARPAAALSATSPPPPPLVLIVNLELAADELTSCTGLSRALTRLTDCRCEVRHYSTLTAASLHALAPAAILLSPQRTPWWRYPHDDLERSFAVVRELTVPTLGVCGGHQYLALCFGGEVAPFDGVPESHPANYDGLRREDGLLPVHRVAADPLLDGIDDLARFRLGHCEEVKRLPATFRLLATGELTHVMAMRHTTRPLYGVQFHPEGDWETCPEGRRLLANFVRLAGLPARA